MDRQEKINLFRCRELMYRFLGGFYIMEVDETQLSVLKKIGFPEIEIKDDADRDISEGYALIKEYVTGIDEKGLDYLAADYAKVFLAAGDAAGRAAFPYESVYVDKRGRVGGSTDAKMQELYKKRGFEPNPDVYRTMNDNIGLILEFMGILSADAVGAFESGNKELFENVLAKQKEIFEKHLLNWTASFAADVVKFADTAFYKGLGRLTAGFIKKEAAFFKEVGLWAM